jgi:hypothetical protein
MHRILVMLIIVITILIITTISWAGAPGGSYVVTTGPPQEQTLTFWSQELGVTSQQAMQEMCDVGEMQYRQRRGEIAEQRTKEATRAMTPADLAALCAIYAKYGGPPCPPAP